MVGCPVSKPRPFSKLKDQVDFGEESLFANTGWAIPLLLAGRSADAAMIQFELAEPRTLTDAVRLLDPGDETIRPIAGGTALMLMMKAGVFRPAKLVSLRNIEPEYATIAAGTDGLTIGAMTTLSDLERSADVQSHAPLITRTLLTLSNVRVRNVATVGGAVAH